MSLLSRLDRWRYRSRHELMRFWSLCRFDAADVGGICFVVLSFKAAGFRICRFQNGLFRCRQFLSRRGDEWVPFDKSRSFSIPRRFSGKIGIGEVGNRLYVSCLILAWRRWRWPGSFTGDDIWETSSISGIKIALYLLADGYLKIGLWRYSRRSTQDVDGIE